MDSRGSSAERRGGATWSLALPPLVWALHFVAIYGVTALTCARAVDEGHLPFTIGALTLVALGAVAYVTWGALRDLHAPSRDGAPQLLLWLRAALCVLAALAIVWEGLPSALGLHCG